MNPESNRQSLPVRPLQSEASSPTSDTRESGYLIVHVTTARGAIPIEGAQVIVRNYLEPPAGDRGDTVATLVSGMGGNTVRLPLSAPPRISSTKPSNGKPYASYVVEVRREGYYDQIYSGVPIFDGITAIQPADLIPLPENGKPDSFTPDSTRITEGEASDL